MFMIFFGVLHRSWDGLSSDPTVWIMEFGETNQWIPTKGWVTKLPIRAWGAMAGGPSPSVSDDWSPGKKSWTDGNQKSPARKPVEGTVLLKSTIIHKASKTSQLVVWDFSHQHYV